MKTMTCFGPGARQAAGLRRWVGILAGFFLVGWTARSEAQTPPARLGPPAISPTGAARFQVEGAADQYLRIDTSQDFLDWLPADILYPATTGRTFLDPLTNQVPARFYRAVSIPTVTDVLGFSPRSGAAGTRVEVFGQFFVPGGPGRHRVTIGGVEARVEEASITRLVAIVPPNAETGYIHVTAPAGSGATAEPFIMMETVPVRFEPPAGVAASAFDIANGHDRGDASQGSVPLLVPQGIPALVFAFNKDTNAGPFFCALRTGRETSITINAFSTAQALIFQVPPFLATDVERAVKILALIAAEPATRVLAGVIERLFRGPADPFGSLELKTSFQAALEALGANPALQSVVGENPVARRIGKQAVTVDPAQFPLEPAATRFVELARKGNAHQVGASPFNPVDWLVKINEVDVARAFPEGRKDLEVDYRREENPPRLYTLLPGFELKRVVSADLASARVNILSFVSKEFFKYLTGSKHGDVDLPGPDRIFLMRAVGPSFEPAADYDFVTRHLWPDYQQAVVANLVAAVVDMLSAVLDADGFDFMFSKAGKNWEKLVFKLVDEAFKQGAPIRSQEDFLGAAFKLRQFFFKELAGAIEKDLFEIKGVLSGKEFVSLEFKGRLTKDWQKTSALIDGVLNNKVLKVGSSVGQVAERASGLFRTTSLESTLILVGDPFRLEILGVAPAAAAPGDTVTITFRAAPGVGSFRPGDQRDAVRFESTRTGQSMEGQVTAVLAPGDGTQTLTVRLPDAVDEANDGNYDLIVTTHGRTGRSAYKVFNHPVVTGLAPPEGFAAVDNFAGESFAGTWVTLTGVLISSADRFFFAGATGAIEARDKSGSKGLVTLRVPAGAKTGPLRVTHRALAGGDQETFSPTFTILGPPALEAISPAAAPASALVVLRLRDHGGEAETVRVKFAGSAAFLTVTRAGPDEVVTLVPADAITGPLTVITPGGQASRPFTVLPPLPLAEGSAIRADRQSVITLERALAFAEGTAFPLGDDRLFPPNGPAEEIDSVSTFNSSPVIRLGPAYANAITFEGSSTLNITFRGNGDSLNGGTHSGAVNLTGIGQRLTGIFTGPVTVSGASNKLGGTYSGPVIVNGDHHSIAGEFLGGLTILGNNNRLSVNCHDSLDHGLVVKGRGNTITGVFRDNQGDGLRVEGGKHNIIDLYGCDGNQGNGLTLTGGADHNQVGITTGTRDSATGQPKPGSGNGGHGVALLADASGNEFRTIDPGCGGNLLDGVRLDGAKVRGNYFLPFHSTRNGGSGFAVLNGAAENQLGDFFSRDNVLAERNGQHGVLLAGASRTTVLLDSRNNARTAATVSDVIEGTPGDTYLEIDTRSQAADPATTATGLRLEGWTENVFCVVNLLGFARGIEFLGADVAGNVLAGQVTGSRGEGVYLSQAQRNEVEVRVEKSGGDGIRLEGAAGNMIRANGINDNAGVGIQLLAGSAGNQITAGPNSFVSRNLAGIVMAGGAHDNQVTGLTVTGNKESGFRFHGGGTARNVVVESIAQGHPNFGVEVVAGANDISFGQELENVPADKRNGNLSDNRIAGALVSGAGSSLALYRCFVSGAQNANGRQPVGVQVDNGASVLLAHNTFFRHATGVLIRNAGRPVTLRANIFPEQINHAIRVEQSGGVTIGGPTQAEANNIYQTQGTGIELSGNATVNCDVWNNDLSQNSRGIELVAGANGNTARSNRLSGNDDGIVLTGAGNNSITGNRVWQNLLAGVLLRGGAATNRVILNELELNGAGVKVDGPTTLHNQILQNRITGNTVKGIALVNGGHATRPAPRLTDLNRATLRGTVEAPDGSRVEVFTDPGNQGQTFRGTATVVDRRFSLPVNFSPGDVGALFNVTATVTDLELNTSEFGGFEPAEEGEPAPGTPRIAFASTRYGNPRIYLLDGEQTYDLTPDGFTNHSPAFACDCTNLLFVSNRDAGAKPDNLDIYLAAPRNGTALTRVTTHPAPDYDPAWLRACASLVFVSERDGNPEIYSMNLDGTNLKRLTTNGAVDRSPAISPDGAQIAFASNRTGNNEIWVMNADGSNARQLTSHPASDSQPAWACDGTTIAFTSERDGNAEIYTIRADGSNLTRLTNDPATDKEPAWSPDSSAVYFTSNRQGAFEVYRAPRAGGAALRISVAYGDSTHPALGAR